MLCIIRNWGPHSICRLLCVQFGIFPYLTSDIDKVLRGKYICRLIRGLVWAVPGCRLEAVETWNYWHHQNLLSSVWTLERPEQHYIPRQRNNTKPNYWYHIWRSNQPSSQPWATGSTDSSKFPYCTKHAVTGLASVIAPCVWYFLSMIMEWSLLPVSKFILTKQVQFLHPFGPSYTQWPCGMIVPQLTQATAGIQRPLAELQ